MSENKSIILLIIHTSLGELRWILPFISEHKEKGSLENKEVVTLFFQSENYDLARKDNAHFELLEQLGQVILKKDIFRFLFSNRRQVKYIFKDFWPITKMSLASQIYWLCPQARLILYPHANALFSFSDQVNQAIENPQKHDYACFDSLLINSKYDTDYWSSKVPKERIMVAGSAAYTSTWIERLGAYESNDLRKKPSHRTVFLNIRGPHEVYLSNEIFDSLLQTALVELMVIKDIYVIIRPHPRQDRQLLLQALRDFDPNRYEISFESIFAYHGKIDFSVNFWSSIITDCVAMDVPSIELYRYEGFWDLLTKDDQGNTISFYSHFGITQFASDRDSLSLEIGNLLENRESVLFEQKLSLNKVFQVPQSINIDSLYDIEHNTMQAKRKNARKYLSWLRVLISSIK